MAFSIALSGLNAASADLSTTGNNIANANTTGFKESRAQFADVFPTQGQGLGGSQIGSGVRVSGIAQQFDQGNIDFTDNSLDLAISGSGFFTLDDGGTLVYSRAGAFGVDREGFVVNQSNQRLQVFPPSANGSFDTGSLADLALSSSENPPRATASIDVNANLPADAVQPAAAFDISDAETYNHTTSATIYDSLGAAHAATLYFVKDDAAGPNAWNVHTAVDGQVVGGASPLAYSTSGQIVTPANGEIALPAHALSNGADDLSVTLDLSDSTQFGSQFGVTSLRQDGFAAGRLTGIEITEQGVVQARFSNGQSSPLGQLALTQFPNAQGLQHLGDTTWGDTFAAGQALRGAPGSADLGVIQSGALESSNVDLTEQLVNMITAQRNFQANAQMISTSDAITQTIINIR